jgi:hypothetical protein
MLRQNETTEVKNKATIRNRPRQLHACIFVAAANGIESIRKLFFLI